MKKFSTTVMLCSALAAILLSSGCVAAIGNRGAGNGCNTVGQQLLDLKKAHDAGAMSDAEYESERGKVLNHK